MYSQLSTRWPMPSAASAGVPNCVAVRVTHHVDQREHHARHRRRQVRCAARSPSARASGRPNRSTPRRRDDRRARARKRQPACRSSRSPRPRCRATESGPIRRSASGSSTSVTATDASQDDERRSRVAGSAERRVDGEEAEDERRAEQVRPEVAHAERRDVRRRVHRSRTCAADSGRPIDRAHRARARARDQRVARHARRRVSASLAVPPRGDRREPDAHHLGDARRSARSRTPRRRRREPGGADARADPVCVDRREQRHQQRRRHRRQRDARDRRAAAGRRRDALASHSLVTATGASPRAARVEASRR